MFVLKKNRYKTQGICIYEDENENSVFCKRTDTGFVSKLRFKDTGISAEPLNIDIPLKELNGTELHLSYDSGTDREKYSPVIKAYTAIVTRWITMCYDLEIMQARAKRRMPIYEDMEKLKAYSELKSVIKELSN